jgi:hypothetical protein
MNFLLRMMLIIGMAALLVPQAAFARQSGEQTSISSLNLGIRLLF